VFHRICALKLTGGTLFLEPDSLFLVVWDRPDVSPVSGPLLLNYGCNKRRTP
jgi:hypothetical protein